MPMRPFLADHAFDDDVVAAMGIAFDRACRAFALVDKEDTVTKVLAQKIIEAAQTGERDPDKLYETVRRWATRRDAPPPGDAAPHVKAGDRRT
ncbi:MAG TPA: hypothetical protein VLX44_20015 [Xanthobacteraceae bacterium]|nr:hypothetical protein [Xanthobacteraceae bacterium]